KGASCLSGAKAHSLDTEKQLATSVKEWSDEQRTKAEIHTERVFLQRQLQKTVFDIWQRYAREAKQSGDPELTAWWAEYEAARVPLADETSAERYRRVENWVKVNKPRGLNAQALKWERQ